MQVPQSAINWFEIPVSNFERARDFYSHIFEINLQEIEAGGNRYALFPSEPAAGVGGALVYGPDYIPSQRGCVIYLRCNGNLEALLEKVQTAGGSIEPEKAPHTEESALSRQVIFRDTEGNRIGLRPE